MDKIIAAYAKEQDLRSLLDSVRSSQKPQADGMSAFSVEKQAAYKNQKTFHFSTAEEEPDKPAEKRQSTGARPNRKLSQARYEEDPLQSQGAERKPSVRLQEQLDLETVSEANQAEFLYSKLLEEVGVLSSNIL